MLTVPVKVPRPARGKSGFLDALKTRPKARRRVRHLEDDEQRALIMWSKSVPELRETLFHIPNGGKRNATTAAILKAMGVRAGVYDLFLPLPIPRPGGGVLVPGFWLEMKSATGTETENQIAWGRKMRALGYETAVAKSFEQGKMLLAAYVQRYRAARDEANG